jgi:hypothetical protein
VREVGLDPAAYGTHSLRRTKASLIYRRTKNLRAVHLLLGHTNLENTVSYLGIEVDDAFEMAEQTEVSLSAVSTPQRGLLTALVRLYCPVPESGGWLALSTSRTTVSRPNSVWR